MTVYAESVETVVGGGPRVTPPAPVPPLPADALRAPSRLANIIDEAIDDKQWGRPQAPEPKGGTHITVSSGTIDCTLVGGEHITIDGEDINHDAVGEEADYVSDTVTELGTYLQIRVGRDTKGHVVSVLLIPD